MDGPEAAVIMRKELKYNGPIIGKHQLKASNISYDNNI